MQLINLGEKNIKNCT